MVVGVAVVAGGVPGEAAAGGVVVHRLQGDAEDLGGLRSGDVHVRHGRRDQSSMPAAIHRVPRTSAHGSLLCQDTRGRADLE